MNPRTPNPPPCVPACAPDSPKPTLEPSPDLDAAHAMTAPVARAVIDATEVGQVLGISSSTVYQLHGREELPPPVQVGTRGLRWVAAEVQAWLMHGTPHRTAWSRIWPRIRKEVMRP